MTDHLLFGLSAAFYAAATAYAIFLWRRGFTRDDWWCYGLLACGAALHTAALFSRGFSLQHCPVSNLYEATMFIGWTLVMSHLVAGLWSRLRFLCALGAPILLILGVFGLQPGLDRPGPVLEVTRGLVSLHAALILLAYGTFGLSAAAALLYLAQEHDLKFRKVRAVLSRLPSMERLERVVTRSLVVGLILLTVGLLPAFWLVESSGGSPVRGDPKVLWSILVWVGYSVLLALRWRRGWGAHSLAWGALASFAFVMLTFWGTNLLSPLHN